MPRILKSGDPFIWLTGAALTTALLMITGLLYVVLSQALGVFWPSTLERLELASGEEVIGAIRQREPARIRDGVALSPDRLQVQIGNRDLFGSDFRWIDLADVRATSRPTELVAFERREWGPLYGRVEELREGENVIAAGEAAWPALQARLPEANRIGEKIRHLQQREIGALNHALERERLHLRRLEWRGAPEEERQASRRRTTDLEKQHEELEVRLGEHLTEGRKLTATVRVAGGRTTEVPLLQVVRAFRPNEMTATAAVRLYGARLVEFLFADPRESNTEGGVFPAIFGTVLMVLLMSIAVVPFGVLTALYLREYARQGWLVGIVRIAVNNLAGVPSIVFGVFGLGFFVYFLGGSLDALFFPERLPTPTYGTGGILWASLTLALLTVPVVVVATEEALAAVPKESREGSLALGATKLETTWRVVLPQALPGILTGLILAMARGAGEVAPLMITGVVKLAPSLPLDGNWPWLHLDRKFMHLGFHIFDVGFQSPNIEAAKPMVYATTLLLVGIVVTLNLAAILLRARLRRRFRTGEF